MRPLLLLSREDVARLLELEPLMEVLGKAFVDLSAGRCRMPQRIGVPVEEHDGWLGVMPAYVPSLGVLATKLVTVYPENRAPLPTHHAVVVVLDPATGVPRALMDGGAITELRTAAASALATRLLAREDARRLAILGTGVQARAHARAIPRVRSITEVRIAGRTPARVEELARELRAELSIPVAAAASYREALDGADIVCAATHSPEPVVQRGWLRAGIHVNSVGVNRTGREVDAATIADAVTFVEARSAALAPSMAGGSNELTWALRDGAIGKDHIRAELGELLAGSATGRTSGEEITLYKGVGVAVEDAAAAALALERAGDLGIGRTMVL